MPTAITDDELFTYSERAKGKVVVITGASELYAMFVKRTLARCCERDWEGDRADFCTIWVSEALH